MNTEEARKILKAAYPFTEVCTQYIARYNTKSGKELALERDRSEAFYVWIQKYNTVILGVTVKNERFPGKPYEVKQPRNSNLNEKNAPGLKPGNRVWYLQIDDIEALKKVVTWYEDI